jgi:hypothetical protein
LLFTGYRRFNASEALVVDESLDVLAGGETVGKEFLFVLTDALFEFGGYADVKPFGVAGEDVNVVDVREFAHG